MPLIDQLQGKSDLEKFRFMNMFIQNSARTMCTPISAYFEITPVCNFQCKMCYSRMTKQDAEAQGGIIDGDTWIRYIQSAIRLGVLYVSFTGGECLLHPEFEKIYRAVYYKGIRPVIFTNGFLLDKYHGLFRELPPYSISLTLYGFSEETYRKTTLCAEGAFDKVIGNIEWVLTQRIPLLLKTTLTRDMFTDFPKILEFVHQKHIPFIYGDTLMKNREACNRECESLGVTKDEVDNALRAECEKQNIEYKVPDIVPEAQDFPTHDTGMQCGSGRSVFAITWRGEMMPCLTCGVYGQKVKPDDSDMLKAWRDINQWVQSCPQIVECQNCVFQHKCRTCIFVHYADMQTYGVPSPRICWKRQHPDKASELLREMHDE